MTVATQATIVYQISNAYEGKVTVDSSALITDQYGVGYKHGRFLTFIPYNRIWRIDFEEEVDTAIEVG